MTHGYPPNNIFNGKEANKIQMMGYSHYEVKSESAVCTKAKANIHKLSN